MSLWILKLAIFAFLAAYTLIRVPFAREQRKNVIADNRKTPQEKASLAGAGVGMMFVPLFWVLTPFLDRFNYALPALVNATGMALLALALWLFYRSHADLGKNWSVTLETREGHELVTGGVYQKVRHPMYAAIFLWVLAYPLVMTNWVAGFAPLVAFSALYFLRVAQEESLMLERFGESYRQYMARTGRVFPRWN